MRLRYIAVNKLAEQGHRRMKTNRSRHLVASSLLAAVALTTALARAADPLPSWNDGKAKQSIIAFVEKVTKLGLPDFGRVPQGFRPRCDAHAAHHDAPVLCPHGGPGQALCRGRKGFRRRNVTAMKLEAFKCYYAPAGAGGRRRHLRQADAGDFEAAGGHHRRRKVRLTCATDPSARSPPGMKSRPSMRPSSIMCPRLSR